MFKKEYAKNGVHKGMHGVIWSEESINGTWDVFFNLCGEHAPIGDITIKEDLMLLPNGMNAKVNENIKAYFDEK